MKRTIRWCMGALLVLGACGDDDGVDPGTDSSVPTQDAGTEDGGTVAVDGGTDDDGGMTVDPRVAACQATLTARGEAVAAMLPSSYEDATEMVREGGDQSLEADYAGRYRDDLANHPGCVPRESYGNNVDFLVSDNEATVAAGTPASIAGYPCAAKEYTQDAEDTTKPIVILVHGNSSSPGTFEEYANASLAVTEITQAGSGFTFTVDSTLRPQLATRLVEAGYRVIAFDARTDLVNTLTDFDADNATGNAFRNIDHGWAVPMLQSLIQAVMTENPDRQVSLVGHSLGVSVIRDALRRQHLAFRAGDTTVNVFAQLGDVILASGAIHGVNAGQLLCESFTHMRGRVGCEMGDRDSFAPTYFTRVNNGPSDYFGAPCADGSFAFGEADQCGGNAVHYTTITMQDVPGGTLQDEFVSEAASSIDLDGCVENELIELSDFDGSAFFFTGFPGFFANHFGSIRSDSGIDLILSKLAD